MQCGLSMGVALKVRLCIYKWSVQSRTPCQSWLGALVCTAFVGVCDITYIVNVVIYLKLTFTISRICSVYVHMYIHVHVHVHVHFCTCTSSSSIFLAVQFSLMFNCITLHFLTLVPMCKSSEHMYM